MDRALWTARQWMAAPHGGAEVCRHFIAVRRETIDRSSTATRRRRPSACRIGRAALRGFEHRPHPAGVTSIVVFVGSEEPSGKSIDPHDSIFVFVDQASNLPAEKDMPPPRHGESTWPSSRRRLPSSAHTRSIRWPRTSPSVRPGIRMSRKRDHRLRGDRPRIGSIAAGSEASTPYPAGDFNRRLRGLGGIFWKKICSARHGESTWPSYRRRLPSSAHTRSIRWPRTSPSVRPGMRMSRKRDHSRESAQHRHAGLPRAPAEVPAALRERLLVHELVHVPGPVGAQPESRLRRLGWHTEDPVGDAHLVAGQLGEQTTRIAFVQAPIVRSIEAFCADPGRSISTPR